MSVTVSTDLEAKRDRLLVTGSVTVFVPPQTTLVALVQGDTRAYTISRGVDGALRCSCKAAEYGRLCAHAMSVALVVDGPWKES